MKIDWRKMVSLTLCLIVLSTAAASGAVIHVKTTGSDSNDGSTWDLAKATVQGAMSDANAGDEIWVAVGQYYGPIAVKAGVELCGGFVGTESLREQRDPRSNPTVLQRDLDGTVITTPPQAQKDTVVDGFTIQHGQAAAGGGIYCEGSPTVSNNTFYANSATGNPYGGGGICCVTEDASPVIAGNSFLSNLAPNGGGAAVSCYRNAPLIINNVIWNNLALFGGGIYCCWGTGASQTPRIVNCSIARNWARYGGAGIYCSMQPAEITNCVVAFNAWAPGVCTSVAIPLFASNCVYGNTSGNYSGMADPAGTDGNISRDPRFVSYTSGDLHLLSESPCIDAGDDTAVQTSCTDIDGQARIFGEHVDIGADEFAAFRVTGDGCRTTAVGDGRSWDGAFDTIQDAIEAAKGLGPSEVWVRACTYNETITLRKGVGVYGGFAGTETKRSERDWRQNLTIIDGGRAGVSVVSASGEVTPMATIDGFVLRNGSSNESGGGISCAGVSPRIVNNRIEYNISEYGAGIACVDASPLIRNNWISGNVANTAGGGIYCTGSSSPRIANNVITANGAVGQAPGYGHGGGIAADGCSPSILNNTIAGNFAGVDGGGVCCRYSASPAIRNSIIAFNSSGTYTDSSDSPPALSYNCVYDNGRYDYYGIGNPTGTNGNISVDPKFVMLELGDVHLNSDSPCIDAGDNTAIPIDSSDLDGDGLTTDKLIDKDADGELRFLDVTSISDTGNGTPPIVDIGADECDETHPPLPASPRVVHVDGAVQTSGDGTTWATAYKTIQEAVNDLLAHGTESNRYSRGGDVWVKAGTYTENIQMGWFTYVYGGFAGTESSLSERAAFPRSQPDPNASIIDGDNSGSPTVQVTTGYHFSAVDGFTLTHNGLGGEGICCYPGTGPTISNNKIKDNRGTHGGVWCSWGSSPIISNNLITGNSGGGVWIDSLSSVDVSNNVIARNVVSGTYPGPGIYCRDRVTGVIRGNVITENSLGGIVCELDSTPTIVNNNITANSIALPEVAERLSGGGGIRLTGSSPDIVNNTILGNNGWHGGGIYCAGGSQPAIDNNIVAFNSTGVYSDDPTGPQLHYNCVYGNTGYDYYGITDQTGDNGNISQDPRFAKQQFGNVHLNPDSPCVDAGDNTRVPIKWAAVDIDGQNRFMDGGHGVPPTVDMGADESDGQTPPVGTPRRLHVDSSNGDDSNEGGTWSTAKKTIQAAVDALAVMPEIPMPSSLGGEVYVREGDYTADPSHDAVVEARTYVYVYGGFDGTEGSLDDRDLSAGHVSYIRPGQGKHGVSAYWDLAYTYENCLQTGHLLGTVDGFSICGLSGGDAVHLQGTSVLVANNTIGPNVNGNGVYCAHSSPVILANTIDGCAHNGIDLDHSFAAIADGNVISGNSTSYDSQEATGGVHCKSASPLIRGNIIRNNGNPAVNGGGICCLQGASAQISVLENSEPKVLNNVISGNSAANGGAIYSATIQEAWPCKPLIASNTITGNTATNGGAIYSQDSSPVIACNVIDQNTAGNGAAVFCQANLPGDVPSPKVVNNTIVSNTITEGSTDTGSAICSAVSYQSDPLDDSLLPLIANNIVASNFAGILYSAGRAPRVHHNCTFSNGGNDYINVLPGDGAIWGDPLFSDALYHLQPLSLCKDAGDSASLPADTWDLDGDRDAQEYLPFDRDLLPRIFGGPSGYVDIGAYELQE